MPALEAKGKDSAGTWAELGPQSISVPSPGSTCKRRIVPPGGPDRDYAVSTGLVCLVVQAGMDLFGGIWAL